MHTEPGPIDEFTAVVDAWNRLPGRVERSKRGWVDHLAGMAGAQHRLVAAGQWNSGPSTLMDVLELTRAEVQNCRVVRWLLDPLAHHGLGSQLLDRLFDLIDIDPPAPGVARVSVEVSRPNSRADIVIEGLPAEGVVVLEAKIDAPEGLNQGQRLEMDWPSAVRFVFLTVAGHRYPTTAAEPGAWRSVTWTWFAEQVDDLADRPTHRASPRQLEATRAAGDWAAGIRRHLR